MKTEKFCPRCEKTLPVTEFTKASGRPDGLQPYCSDHMKQYRKEHYNSNKEQYRHRNNVSKAKLIEYVVNYKETHGCFDCPETYPNEPWMMEFDHRESETKVAAISTLVGWGSMTRLLAEIDKCDLVCVVCHKRRTAKRAGYQRNRYSELLLD